jgi:hypothetical protein
VRPVDLAAAQRCVRCWLLQGPICLCLLLVPTCLLVNGCPGGALVWCGARAVLLVTASGTPVAVGSVGENKARPSAGSVLC